MMYLVRNWSFKMTTRKLNSGEIYTSHGINTAPKSSNVIYTSANNKINKNRWIAYFILISLVGIITFVVVNIDFFVAIKSKF